MADVRTLNVYCDESCHIEHDHIPVMAWGALYCSAEDSVLIHFTSGPPTGGTKAFSAC
jgi:hypothetical protein